jgi:hypothetical protein
MIVVAIIAVAMIAHPSLLAYLLVALVGGWLMLMREVARREGASHSLCKGCVVAGAGIIAVAFFVLIKINWLAL